MVVWDYPRREDDVWITASKNEERADWAEEAVERFRDVCRGENDITAIYDLIGNLGHLYDRLVATYDTGADMMVEAGAVDNGFEDIVRLGLMHYHAERGEGDDIEQANRYDD